VLVLKRDPLCKIEEFVRRLCRSTEADHVVPIRAGGARFDLANDKARASLATPARRQ
jgi:hypothetical protein